LGSFSTLESNFESHYDFKIQKADEKKSPILYHLLAGHDNFLKEVPDHPVKKHQIALRWIAWAKVYQARLLKDGDIKEDFDSRRMKRMNLVNPKFCLKSWILSDICDSVDDSSKSADKLEQAVRILIHNVWGNESDMPVEDRRLANLWSRPCYDKYYNQYQLNCP
jgi:uncharacterized protein YdiU (UPF0061 family)